MMLDYYRGVRAAQGYQAQCLALGESPWAASHYNASGGQPGSDLVEIIRANDLTQYDAAPQPIPSVPTNIIEELIGMNDPQGVVRLLYRICLVREPDAAGFATFTNQLANGGTVNDVMQQLQDSAEGQAVIKAQRKAWGIS
jgi:hypothetical protein